MTLAAVFPGQGAQSPGMLSKLAAEFPVVGEMFGEASEVLGYDAWHVTQNSTVEKLRQTEITQPLMYVSGAAVWRVWQQLELPKPAMMAGHSLGEYTALHAAGAVDFITGLKLVDIRGRLMAGAVAPDIGGMAALLGFDDKSAVALCEELNRPDAVVEAVNFNAPGQIVISGHLPALENACKQARENGARKAMLLDVSVPNHSSLMQPAQDELAKAIDDADLSITRVPVLQNANAKAPADLSELLRSLKAHIVNPVHWTRTVQRLKESGIETVVELGPGKVLAGLCKRIDRSLNILPVQCPETLEKARDALFVEHC